MRWRWRSMKRWRMTWRIEVLERRRMKNEEGRHLLGLSRFAAGALDAL